MTPYHDFFFGALASDPAIDLMVYYRVKTEKLYYWQLSDEKCYRWKQLDGFLGLDFSVLSLPWKQPDAFYVVTGIKGPVKSLLVALLSLMRRRYAFWTDTPPDDYLTSLKGQLRKVLFTCIFRRACAICTTGISGRRYFLRQGVPEERIVNLPFFWDLNVPRLSYSEQEASKSWFAEYVRDGDFVFILSGKLVEWKGYDKAIWAARQLLNRTSSSKIKWLLAGEGPQRAALQESIARYGLQKHFHLLGWLDGARLQYFYEIGHVFVHPAEIDPFPTVVLKAMVHGKPVIGYEGAGSVSDRVVSGYNGFVIAHGDTDALVEKMLYCVEHPAECRSMGRNARLTAEQWPVSLGVETVKRLVSAE